MKYRLLFAWAIVVLAAAVQAQEATLEQMNESAITAQLGRSLEKQNERIQHARVQVLEIESRDPNERHAADVLFPTALRDDQFAKLVDRFDLDVRGIELKIPIDSNGTVLTMFRGATDLLSVKGSNLTKVRHATSVAREEILEIATALEHGNQPEDARLATDYRDAASKPIHIYRAEIIGSASQLRRLHDDRKVLVVRPDSDRSKISHYDMWKNRYEAARAEYKNRPGSQD